MNDLRVRRKSFNVSIFNIKILPQELNVDYTDQYIDLFKRLYSENIAANTRGDKWMEIRTQFSHEGDSVLYGKLIYYTILDGKDWYNRREKTLQQVDLGNDLYPNAKEIEYYFIPKAHRFCFINKTNGIAMSQIEIFLKKSLSRLLDEDMEVAVYKELTSDIIDRIISAPKLFRLEIGISYTNNDLSDEFEKLWDDEMKEGKIHELKLNAKSFKSDSINLENSNVLKGALKLSQSNGFAEATIQAEDGKNENVSTIDYPRRELISTTEGNEHRDVYSKIMSIFRHGQRG